MRLLVQGAFAGLMLTGIPSLAFAWMGGHGGGIPGCEQAVTNVPWGTVDDTCVGGPSDKYGWTGGVGGPGMRISAQGHKDWPNFPAPVSGHGYVAGQPDGQARLR